MICATKVAWVHLDRQMIVTIHRQVVTRISRFSVSHDHQRTWLLHIRGAQPEDAGHYMCQVNSDPMVSQVGTVYVVGSYHSDFFPFYCCVLLMDTGQISYW